MYEFTIKKRVNDSQIHPHTVDLVQLNEAHTRGSGHKNDRPLVYPHATMLDLTTVEAYTGLFFYDLDNNFAPEELIHQPYVFRAYKSASGTGSHVWIKAPKELDSTNFKDLYLAVGDDLRREFGIKYDPACAQPTRMAFIPKQPLQVDNPECERYQYQWVDLNMYQIRLNNAVEGERNTTLYQVAKDAYKNGEDITDILMDYIHSTFPKKEWQGHYKTVQSAFKSADKEFEAEDQKEDLLEGFDKWLEESEVDLLNPPPMPTPRLSVSDTPLLLNGGALLIKAPPKSGKSRLIGYMIDALTGKDAGAITSTRLPENVVYFDTEQAVFSITERVNHADNLKVYSMVDLNSAVRFEYFLEFLERFHPCVAIVDNLRDMASDGVNDEKQSSKMFDRIHKAQGDSSLILVQHTNKEGLNASGHLGSFAEQKAHAIIAVKYDKQQGTFFFEGSGRFGAIDNHSFTWDTAPIVEALPQGEVNDLPHITKEMLSELFESERKYASELYEAFKAAGYKAPSKGGARNNFRAKLGFWKECGWIEKTIDNKWRMVGTTFPLGGAEEPPF